MTPFHLSPVFGVHLAQHAVFLKSFLLGFPRPSSVENVHEQKFRSSAAELLFGFNGRCFTPMESSRAVPGTKKTTYRDCFGCFFFGGVGLAIGIFSSLVTFCCGNDFFSDFLHENLVLGWIFKPTNPKQVSFG